MAATSKQVTRTIRIEDEVDSFLQKYAEQQGLSVNSLVGKILRKYVDWDAYAGKFGMVTYGSTGLAKLLDCLSEEQVRKYAREVSGYRTKEIVAFWFKEVNFRNYLRMLKLIENYSGLFKIEERSEKGKRTIVCHHGMGRNWSIFYEEGFRSAFDELFSINVETEISDNQLIIHLPEQEPQVRREDLPPIEE